MTDLHGLWEHSGSLRSLWDLQLLFHSPGGLTLEQAEQADIYFPASWKAGLHGEGRYRQPPGASENCFRAQGKRKE